MPRRLHKSFAAFTLIELLTVLTIVLILATMIAGIFGNLRERAEKVKCSENLKGLYVAAAAYVEQNGRWPQISPKLVQEDEKSYARAWIEALGSFGLSQKNWVCPAVQRMVGDPDLSKAENIRVDYIATPFDDRSNAPYLWPKQPWFAERGAVHEGGNLLIFANGQIASLKDALQLKGN